MRNWSEVAVFAGVVLSVIVPGGLILRQNHQLRSLLAGKAKVLTEGVHLESPIGYRWDSHKATLVIALRSGCPYCEASMGFYGRILRLWAGQSLKAYPIALYPDAATEVGPEIHGIQRLTDLDYAKMGIASTPTVLLVDSRGMVLRKWAGQLPRSDEEKLIGTVRELSLRLR